MATDVLPDDKALREGRRRRALAQMEEHGIDALLLGREANARYVSGATRLWTAGTRPFGPGCVLVRATGAVHLVSTWDEGIPEDVPHEHLFGITWNPGNLVTWLRGIEGLADAKRIGTDSQTPRFAELLPRVFAGAEFVDAEPALERARRVKTAEEIDAVRIAVTVAETALAAAVAELRPGVTERHLTAVFMQSMAANEVTTPATQQVARVLGPTAVRRGAAVIGASDVVAFDGGVVAAGYIGEVGRTWPADPAAAGATDRVLVAEADALMERLVGTCTPGAPCAALLRAYDDAGHALPDVPVAFGLGLGFDTPVVTRQLARTAADERFEEGMVLALSAHVTGDGDRAHVRKEVVLVTAGGPELLTTAPRWRP